jgi:hypothetical protein
VAGVTDPSAAQQPPNPDVPLVTIGDIVVTKDWVYVPQGRFPLRGTTWTVQDATQVNEVIPTWAIIVAIVVALVTCLLGLLFLLVKEQQYVGYVSVTVAGEGLYHTVQFAAGPTSALWANGQAAQARALAAAA